METKQKSKKTTRTKKLKIDLGFADLYCKEKDAQSISKVAKFAYLKNKRFFKRDIKKKFKIIVVYSRKELNKEWGGKTETWLTACSDFGRIATFPDNLIRKYNPRKDVGNLTSSLLHEMNHQFYYQIVGGRKPSWLLEGLAMQIDGYKMNKYDKKIFKQKLPPLCYSHTEKGYWKYADFLSNELPISKD